MSPTSPAIADLPPSATTAPTRTRTTRKRRAPTDASARRIKRERRASTDCLPRRSPPPRLPIGILLDEDTDGDELTSGEKKRRNEKQNRRELTDAIGGIQSTLLSQGVRFDIDLLQNHNQRTSGLRFKKVETLARAHRAIVQGSRLAEAIERLRVPDEQGAGGEQPSWMSEKHVDELIDVLQGLAGQPTSD